MAEQAVNVIYKLAENPDVICEEILKDITKIVMTQVVENSSERSDQAEVPENETQKEMENEGQEKENTESAVESSQPEPSQSQGFHLCVATVKAQLVHNLHLAFWIILSSFSEENIGLHCPSGILARLLSIVGHIAFKQLYHLDVSTNNELKRRESIQEEKKDGKKRKELEREKEKKRKSKEKVKNITAVPNEARRFIFYCSSDPNVE